MKRWVAVAALLMMCGTAVMSQVHTGYVDFLPGYQFSVVGGKTDYTVDKGFVGSVDAGYYFTRHFGLHVGYFYNDWKINNKFEGWYWSRATEGSFYVFELGPEFVFNPSENTFIYGQINVGTTAGAGKYAGGRHSNQLTGGAAIGLRYYFSHRVGVTGQIAYHRINKWSPMYHEALVFFWDARLGVVIRFGS